jgi:hypothetical protein
MMWILFFYCIAFKLAFCNTCAYITKNVGVIHQAIQREYAFGSRFFVSRDTSIEREGAW